jgi:hypothetical protein
VRTAGVCLMVWLTYDYEMWTRLLSGGISASDFTFTPC